MSEAPTQDEQATEFITKQLRIQMDIQYLEAMGTAVLATTGQTLTDKEIRDKTVFMINEKAGTKTFVFEGKELLSFGPPTIKTIPGKKDTELKVHIPIEKLYDDQRN